MSRFEKRPFTTKHFSVIFSLLGCLPLIFFASPCPSHKAWDTSDGAFQHYASYADQIVPSDSSSFPGYFETSQWPVRLTSENLVPTNGSTLFSWGTYLFGSDDAGQTWRHLVEPVSSRATTALIPSPDFEHDCTLFAGLDWGDDALRISNDGGMNWHSSQQSLPGQIGGIFISPAFSFDKIVYAVQSTYPVSTIWRSIDGGEHWTKVNSPPRSSPVAQVALSPYIKFDQTLFVLLDDSSLWRSSNNGVTWERTDASLGVDAGNHIYALDTVPLSDGTFMLFAATKVALVTTFDNGQTWYLVDWVSLSHLAVSDGLIIFGIEKDSGQLLRSADLGDSWKAMLPGQRVLDVALSLTFTSDGTVYANDALNLWASQDGGQTWKIRSGYPDLSLHFAP